MLPFYHLTEFHVVFELDGGFAVSNTGKLADKKVFRWVRAEQSCDYLNTKGVC